MIESEFARAFASEWIEAWNAHDLERILSHYSDDFEMSSPLIVEREQVPSGAGLGSSPRDVLTSPADGQCRQPEQVSQAQGQAG